MHKIRLATVDDSREILEIYAPYVKDTSVSFEIQVPTLDEFEKRVEGIIEKYPYCVYEADGKIAGYAYAARHRERAAYMYDVDVSIYVLPKYHKTGVAEKLYLCLFDILKELGYINIYAAYTNPNEKSRKFHEKVGFEYLATFYKTGYKFGNWYDVIWMQKIINDFDKPKEIKSITELSESYLDGVFKSIR